jgi:glycerophosphoryl diester phosphodiesterase
VTSDGVAVLFHDDDLDRTTDARGRISDLPWRDVRSVATAAGNGEIMRLDEALEEFGTQRFNLDLKTDRSVEAFLEVLDTTRGHQRVLVGSFRDARPAQVRRRVGPALATSAGPREVARAVAASRLRAGRAAAPSDPILAMQVPVRAGRVPVVTPQFIGLAHARGQHVHVWTVDDRAEMERLIDLGVDGIITDRPSVLREVLESRGLWQGEGRERRPRSPGQEPTKPTR